MERLTKKAGPYNFYPHPVIRWAENHRDNSLEIYRPQQEIVTMKKREWTVGDYFNYWFNEEVAPTEIEVRTPIERTEGDLVLKVEHVTGFAIIDGEKDENGNPNGYYVEYSLAK